MASAQSCMELHLGLVGINIFKLEQKSEIWDFA